MTVRQHVAGFWTRRRLRDLEAENSRLRTEAADHEQEITQATQSAVWTALYYESNQRDSFGGFETGVIPKTVRWLYRIAEDAPASIRAEILKLIGELRSPEAARSRRITADALDASIRNGQFKGDDNLRGQALAWIEQVRAEQNGSC